MEKFSYRLLFLRRNKMYINGDCLISDNAMFNWCIRIIQRQLFLSPRLKNKKPGKKCLISLSNILMLKYQLVNLFIH